MLPQVTNSGDIISTSWDTKIQSFLWANELFFCTEEGTVVTFEKE
jgi:hypothetical protein